MRLCSAILFFVFLCGLTSGCKPARKPFGLAFGKVTLRGQPLTSGSVVFENASLGVSQIADIKGDGSYEMRTHEGPGLPVGSYKVVLRAGKIASTGNEMLAAPPSASSEAPAFPVPEKYRSAATTPLTADVQAGNKSPFDFALTDGEK